MALVKVSGVGLVLLLIAVALISLVNPMTQAISNILPSSSDPVLATYWDPDIDTMLRAVVIDSYSHALEEHPAEAPLVHQCLNDKGQYVAFKVDSNRYLRVCVINDATIGFQIVDKIGKVMKEKTAYIKDNFKCINDVFDYARRMGYPRFTKPIF